LERDKQKQQKFLEHDPTLAVDSEDCTNAFNELERGAIADTLSVHDPDLLQHFIAYYSSNVPQYFRMANGDLINIPSRRGGIQGDSVFSTIFDIVYTLRVLEPLALAFPACNVYAIHDDSYIIGPADALPPASHRLTQLGSEPSAACVMAPPNANYTNTPNPHTPTLTLTLRHTHHVRCYEEVVRRCT